MPVVDRDTIRKNIDWLLKHQRLVTWLVSFFGKHRRRVVWYRFRNKSFFRRC